MAAMKLKIFACALTLLVTSGFAQQRPRITGFFTDMGYIKEAGDVVGTEVWIVYGDGYYATVQRAEGAPTAPQVVPVEVNGQEIRFTLHEKLWDQDRKPLPDLELNYKGTVSRDRFSGTVTSGAYTARFTLKRGNSYWQ